MDSGLALSRRPGMTTSILCHSGARASANPESITTTAAVVKALRFLACASPPLAAGRY